MIEVIDIILARATACGTRLRRIARRNTC